MAACFGGSLLKTRVMSLELDKKFGGFMFSYLNMLTKNRAVLMELVIVHPVREFLHLWWSGQHCTIANSILEKTSIRYPCQASPQLNRNSLRLFSVGFWMPIWKIWLPLCGRAATGLAVMQNSFFVWVHHSMVLLNVLPTTLSEWLHIKV